MSTESDGTGGLRIDILTLFPAMVRAVLGESIVGRAGTSGVAELHAHDIREHTDNRHRKVDDRPFGGGPGMVMMCQPLWDCVRHVEGLDPRPTRRILTSPQGRPLDQSLVEELAAEPRLLIIAGHYEGIDERVVDRLAPEEISVGDYVLSGGELPALVLTDAVVRLLPGALGHQDSAAEDSFSERNLTDARGTPLASGRLLDCPHFTRPRVWEDQSVPDVLLSGDHAAVDRWRAEQMIERTRARRPELLEDNDGA
ncbi:MAG: tRNA (guanosine(37)-N1)-methyltransferase TrmD [Phycisphaerales bacterium]